MSAEGDLNYSVHINEDDEERQGKGLGSLNIPLKDKKDSIISKSTNVDENRDSIYQNKFLEGAAHPKACIFTFFFKVMTILSYFLISIFITNDSILIFIAAIIFTSFDFWTVKNVTGRMLVGLRWWNDYKEDGTEVWIFESYDTEFKPNNVDSTFFWTSQVSASIFWSIMLFLDIISLKLYWALLTGIISIMTTINLVAFFKCSHQHQKKLKEMTQSGIKSIGNEIFKKAFNLN